MKSNITISLTLDDNRMPEKIEWIASDSDMNSLKESKAMMLSLWDTEEKQTLGIDLWTEKMLVEEMNIFVFQAIIKMADTYKRATQNAEAAGILEKLANEFAAKVNG